MLLSPGVGFPTSCSVCPTPSSMPLATQSKLQRLPQTKQHSTVTQSELQRLPHAKQHSTVTQSKLPKQSEPTLSSGGWCE